MAVDPLSDDEWTERCTAFMVVLDPELDPLLARPLAAELCLRSRWRAMAPEEAAQTLFDVGGRR